MEVGEFRRQAVDVLKALYPSAEAAAIVRAWLEDRLGTAPHELSLQHPNELDAAKLKALEVELSRMARGEPLQYILGKTPFWDLQLKVGPGALIPRPETEELIEWVLETFWKHRKEAFHFLEIGTGSGCIALALLRAFPNSRVTALDISAEALAVAEENFSSLCQTTECSTDRCEFHELDIFAPKAWQWLAESQKFDVIISNPPYVPAEELNQLHQNVVEYEPHIALFPEGDDPLIFYRDILENAHKVLKAGGFIFMEYHPEKVMNVFHLADAAPNIYATEMRRDQYDRWRMLRARILPN